MLANDRARARHAADPWANLCVLATTDADGMPHARVVVLRDLRERLAIFFNSTSPKHEQIVGSSRHAVLVYLASLGVQYRMRVGVEPVPSEIVARSWLERPRIPKVMDWFYTNVQRQSSVVSSRDALLEGFARLDDTLPEDVEAPRGAVGFYLNADEVERLELAGNRVHSRQRYRRDDDRWTVFELVP
jgi:pyridoxamine 5'-phosphate oxidase